MAKLDHAPNNFRGINPDALKRLYTQQGFSPSLTPLPPTKTLVMPSKTLLGGFPYTPASKTDVRETWRRFGWSPVHE